MYNVRFEHRHDGFYCVYVSKYWNKIECQYLNVTNFIKLFHYGNR